MRSGRACPGRRRSRCRSPHAAAGERTYLNKAIEIFRALQIESRYSKKEILEIYLSIAPLGGNVEGLRSAALLY